MFYTDIRKLRIFRRWLSLLLILVFLLGVTGCGQESQEPGIRGHIDQKGQPQGEETQTTPETQEPQEETPPATEAPAPGWNEDANGDVRFYGEDGAPITGFYEVTPEAALENPDYAAGWYYFGEDGVMQKNCRIEDGENIHYLTASGLAAAPGWYSDDTGWYCLEEQGKLLRDVVFSQEGAHYIINADGYLCQIRHEQLTGSLVTGDVAGEEITYTMLDSPVHSCTEFSFMLASSGPERSSDILKWHIWLLKDGKWMDMEGQYETSSIDGMVTVSFPEPVDFDAVHRSFFLGFGMQSLEPVLLDVVIQY